MIFQMKTSSTNRLLTTNFIKVCLSNLFLFSSLYLVLPILPFYIEYNKYYGIPGWSLLLFFIAGLILGGPFHNYFIEQKNRKRVCITAIYGLLISHLLYLVNGGYSSILMLSATIQGISFGLATAANITVAIDVTDSQKRSKGNLIYAWAGRLGMLLSIPTGIVIYLKYGFELTIYTAIVLGALAIFFTAINKIPFRAPIGATPFSLDRFFLPNGWKIILMMVALSFIVGSIFPLFMSDIIESNFYVTHRTIEFITLPFIVFLISAVIAKLEIDALNNHKITSIILLNTPLLFIAFYFLFIYDGYLSTVNKIPCVLLIVRYIQVVIRGFYHKKSTEKINKWQLTPYIKTEVTTPILSGVLCIILSLSLFKGIAVIDIPSNYRVIIPLLFFGLARVSSPILMLLVVTSKHCERGTANTSHILAWEVGLALGCAITIAQNLTELQVLRNALILLIIILVLHIIIYIELYKKRNKHIKESHKTSE